MQTESTFADGQFESQLRYRAHWKAIQSIRCPRRCGGGVWAACPAAPRTRPTHPAARPGPSEHDGGGGADNSTPQ